MKKIVEEDGIVVMKWRISFQTKPTKQLKKLWGQVCEECSDDSAVIPEPKLRALIIFLDHVNSTDSAQQLSIDDELVDDVGEILVSLCDIFKKVLDKLKENRDDTPLAEAYTKLIRTFHLFCSGNGKLAEKVMASKQLFDVIILAIEECHDPDNASLLVKTFRKLFRANVANMDVASVSSTCQMLLQSSCRGMSSPVVNIEILFVIADILERLPTRPGNPGMQPHLL